MRGRWIQQMRQNFIAQFIQLLKHWLCGQVLSWRRTGLLLLTNAGCKHCSFQCISSIYTLFRCNGFIGIQKAVVDQMGSILPNSDHDLFLVQVWLWEVLWSFFLVRPLSRSCGSYRVHFSLPVTIRLRNGSLLLHRKKEDNTSKWQFFSFAINSWGTHLSSIFTFPICFNCQTTRGWLTLSS